MRAEGQDQDGWGADGGGREHVVVEAEVDVSLDVEVLVVVEVEVDAGVEVSEDAGISDDVVGFAVRRKTGRGGVKWMS